MTLTTRPMLRCMRCLRWLLVLALAALAPADRTPLLRRRGHGRAFLASNDHFDLAGLLAQPLSSMPVTLVRQDKDEGDLKFPLSELHPEEVISTIAAHIKSQFPLNLPSITGQRTVSIQSSIAIPLAESRVTLVHEEHAVESAQVIEHIESQGSSLYTENYARELAQQSYLACDRLREHGRNMGEGGPLTKLSADCVIAVRPGKDNQPPSVTVLSRGIYTHIEDTQRYKACTMVDLYKKERMNLAGFLEPTSETDAKTAFVMPDDPSAFSKQAALLECYDGFAWHFFSTDRTSVERVGGD